MTQPPPPQNVDPSEYFSDEDLEDYEGYDSENMVDSSKEWQCEFCTYLNSLEVDICEMCAKSRRSVASSHEEEDFVSGNSQVDDAYYDSDAGSNPVENDVEPEIDGDRVHCPKCTMLNRADLNVCQVCGASLHKAPISNGVRKNLNHSTNGVRSQSSASKSSGRRSRANR